MLLCWSVEFLLLLFFPWLVFAELDFSAFFIAMITMASTIVIQTSNATVNDWVGNSGTAGVEEAVGAVFVAVLITETVPTQSATGL